MDPLIRVRDFLLDNIGHMTHPGTGSFDSTTNRWFVPICCRTENGEVIVGDVEVDGDGHIVFAPGRNELLLRLQKATSQLVPKETSLREAP